MLVRVALVVSLVAGLVTSTSAQCQVEEAVFPGAAVQDLMGTAVAMRGQWAVAGAKQIQVTKSGKLGYAQVYRNTGSGWTPTQTLPGTNFSFGESVDTDGTRIAVGAPGFISQRVEVYTFDGAQWVTEQTIFVPGMQFGHSIAIRGRWLAIGTGGFSVSLYERTGTTWVLNDVITQPATGFANSLAIERGVLAIGSSSFAGFSDGRVDLYRLQSGNWQYEQTLTSNDPNHCNFGSDVDIDKGVVIVSVGCDEAVLFYERVGFAWTETDRVSLPPPVVPTPTAVTVDVSGDLAVAGVAPAFSNADGATYMLRKTQGSWSLRGELCQSSLSGAGGIGTSVAIDDSVMVGNPSYQGTGATLFYPREDPNAPVTCTISTKKPAGVGIAKLFDGSSSAAPGATIVDHQWDFGDGTFASGPTPTKTFAASGVFTVSLATTNSNGSVHTCSFPQTVTDPPTCEMDASAILFKATFDGSLSNDPDGSIAGFFWDFGDGQSQFFIPGSVATHTYFNPGTYTVTQTVVDDLGIKTSCSTDVTVPMTAPVCSFTGEIVFGATVGFSAAASFDPDGTIVSHDWDFGDGTQVSGGIVIAHTYATPGTYTVELTLTDDSGEVSVCEMDIVVP